jgi:hypothetical protein
MAHTYPFFDLSLADSQKFLFYLGRVSPTFQVALKEFSIKSNLTRSGGKNFFGLTRGGLLTLFALECFSKWPLFLWVMTFPCPALRFTEETPKFHIAHCKRKKSAIICKPPRMIDQYLLYRICFTWRCMLSYDYFTERRVLLELNCGATQLSALRTR